MTAGSTKFGALDLRSVLLERNKTENIGSFGIQFNGGIEEDEFFSLQFDTTQTSILEGELKATDELVMVNGVSVIGRSQDQVLRLLQAAGLTVKLQVLAGVPNAIKPRSVLDFLNTPSTDNEILALRNQCKDDLLTYAVPVTTRPRFAFERDGREYHFVSETQFQDKKFVATCVGDDGYKYGILRLELPKVNEPLESDREISVNELLDTSDSWGNVPVSEFLKTPCTASLAKVKAKVKEIVYEHVVPVTTRAKRGNEEEGLDWYFVSTEEFQLRKKDYLESGELTTYYATPKIFKSQWDNRDGLTRSDRLLQRAHARSSVTTATTSTAQSSPAGSVPLSSEGNESSLALPVKKGSFKKDGANTPKSVRFASPPQELNTEDSNALKSPSFDQLLANRTLLITGSSTESSTDPLPTDVETTHPGECQCGYLAEVQALRSRCEAQQAQIAMLLSQHRLLLSGTTLPEYEKTSLA